jgi:FG-GAP repeat protein
MTTRLLALPLALCVLALGPASAEATSRVAGDFNGDGFDDLAVGVPLEDVSSSGDAGALNVNAGAVNVIYGSANRLTAEGNQLWTQDSTGIEDAAEELDFFGWSLAAGDFNGDGFDDLAVGVPLQDVGSVRDAGAVNVIYGSALGLTAEASGTPNNQLWHQDGEGIVDAPETEDFFGLSLTAGDFDGDGFDDLAVGVPSEDVGSAGNAGAVNVIYGAGVGLRVADGSQFWHQDSTGIADAAEQDDFFGSSLTAGDFNGDGHDDLAVGVGHVEAPSGFGEDVGSIANAGAVNVIYGSATRLTATGNQRWHQNTTGIADATEQDDGFGSSLAAGDFDGDGFDDLAVGVPSENVGSIENAGAVNVIYGSASRLTADGNQFWHQDSTGIAEAAEASDFFGNSLTAGDFNGSGHDDLAVGGGVRLEFGGASEDVRSVQDAGAVNVIYGAGVGLRADGNQFWHQDSDGILDAAEAEDLFGFSLTAGDFNGSGHDDLAVGVVFEDVGGFQDAGAVNVIYGSATRLTATGNQRWHQNSTGIADAAEQFDGFGFSLPT